MLYSIKNKDSGKYYHYVLAGEPVFAGRAHRFITFSKVKIDKVLHDILVIAPELRDKLSIDEA